MPTTPQVTPFVTGAALSIAEPGTRENEKGEAVSFQIEAFNATNYTATELPTGLSINAGTGLITGTPTTVQVKTVKVTVKGGSPPGEASTTFKWTIAEAVVSITPPWPGKRPPLELQVELVYPDGSTKRWDKDAKEAKDRATGITFRTQRYTGFADAQLTLNRRIDLEYPDLGLLDGLNLIGHDGSVAYEGRIASMPRSLQTGPSIAVQAQGWMSHAKDQPFVENYVDRVLSKWQAVSRVRLANLLASNRLVGSPSVVPDETSGFPGVLAVIQDSWASLYTPIVEGLYDAGPGNLVASIYYDILFSESAAAAPAFGGGAGFNFQFIIAATDAMGSPTFSANLATAANVTGTFTAPAGRFAELSYFYNTTPGGTQGSHWQAAVRNLAVYGPHGLTKRGPEPGGFYVSDMMKDIATRFAPKLDTSGIQETTFPVPHAVFSSNTLPYDAFQQLNAYHRWELDVFEKRRLNYHPIDLNDWDWEIRLSDPGTTVTLQGDDTTNLCNGVVVNYRDLNTGNETRLTPEAFPQLRDESANNPANLNGLKLYTAMSLSEPNTQEGALQMGRAFLAEFNQAKSPGAITVQGHLRDRAGHWQQAWKVRASDRLVISDLPNDRVRVVGETQWNHDSKQLVIAVDSSMKRLDAILARLGVAVEASNVVLP